MLLLLDPLYIVSYINVYSELIARQQFTGLSKIRCSRSITEWE